jgi:diketogulonate reductase-like aldo/keto reductase
MFLCVQVLLKWNIQRGVVVIPRSQSEKNIKANIDGAFSWELTPEQKVRPRPYRRTSISGTIKSTDKVPV